MSDIAAFLGARLDEDEAHARAAVCPSDSVEWTAVGHPGEYWAILDRHSDLVAEVRPERAAEAGVAAHFALHDPARVLREVAVGRKVLFWYADTLDASETFREKLGTGTHMATAAESYLNVIRVLAAVYSDHPDYDEAWRTL